MALFQSSLLKDHLRLQDEQPVGKCSFIKKFTVIPEKLELTVKKDLI